MEAKTNDLWVFIETGEDGTAKMLVWNYSLPAGILLRNRGRISCCRDWK